ncbi:hypothetical protein O6B72_06410 [Campylobacter ureolyticus]|uniref:hypothetical protein n=1 Tax=Campylobacter ureolyticus TaxID=827 RepID=UPI0022B33FB0|nr:hypothetical protein [Campylobacter ureolyticus]MCZ6156442.1 hypothetical protein [Campylobacter ureolyticus]
MTQEEIKQEKEKTQKEVEEAMKMLHSDAPTMTEGVSALLGSGIGAAGSWATLGTIGVAGYSASGITSGLAAAGSVVGGGMVAGVAVLAAPVAALGVIGYAIAKKRKNAKIAVAVATAIKKLYSIQERLMQNAEYFKEELVSIKAMLDIIETNAKKDKINYSAKL